MSFASVSACGLGCCNCIKAGKGVARALGKCRPAKVGNQAGKGGNLHSLLSWWDYDQGCHRADLVVLNNCLRKEFETVHGVCKREGMYYRHRTGLAPRVRCSRHTGNHTRAGLCTLAAAMWLREGVQASFAINKTLGSNLARSPTSRAT